MKKVILGLIAGISIAMACPGVEGCGCMAGEDNKKEVKEYKCSGEAESKEKVGCGMPECSHVMEESIIEIPKDKGETK